MPIVSCVCALLLCALSTECFRTLQMTGYRPQRGYFRLYASRHFVLLTAVQIVVVLVRFFVPFGAYVNLGVLALCAVVVNATKRKSPLRFTKRIARMMTAELVLLCPLCVFVGYYLWVWMLPIITLCAYALCLPIDLAIARHYVRRAQKKLADSAVTVVAITGSYGKTSAKDMLCALLNDSIAPLGSCNTPLGIASFVNKTDLGSAKYLVLEFGARKQGDIRQLCTLYKPHCGVVTGVCAQHLATFKTLFGVISAKRELVECLPADGFCVLNSDDVYASAFDVGTCAKYFSRDGLAVVNKEVTLDGTRFSLEREGKTYPVVLPQISDYIDSTFVLAMKTALCLGQSVEQTLANVCRVSPTPHRLQLVRCQDFCILDDSYNAGTAGVKGLVRTLEHFHCTKVVITQGIVECGRLAREMNEQCGKLVGSACDVAVVLGRNAKYLAEGLQTTSCKVLYAHDLNEAVALAKPYVTGGILVFQNDLPDSVTI